jgi:hypothetical protein
MCGLMTTGVPVLTRVQRIVVVCTAAAVALTRLVPLSQGPWDWDEVLFCHAVRDYNVAAHQPHPLGFPLYIALAKLARFFTDSDFHALQVVNVLLAMCVFPVAFWVARGFRFDFLSSFATALCMAFLPNVWFYGGTVFSDLPAMVFFLSAVAAYLWAGAAQPEERAALWRYALASVLLAAAVLVRPQNALVAVFPWTMATYRLLRARRFVAVALCSLLLIGIVAGGYVAAAVVTGPREYIEAVKNHSAYVRRSDTITSTNHPGLAETLRLQLDPYDAGKVTILLNVLAAVAILRGRRDRVVPILLTFLPVFVFTTLALHPLGASRFSLNYMTGIVLLGVEGTAVVARWAVWLLARMRARLSSPAEPALRIALMAAIILRFGTWVLPAFTEPCTRQPPPTEAVLWLRDHTPPGTPVFADGGILPWTRYYLPRHKVYYLPPDKIPRHPDAARGWFVAMGAAQSPMATEFLRPHNRTWNVVTKRGFEAFIEPASQVAAFPRGWHGIEGGDVETWRWSKRNAVMELGPCPGQCELRIRYLLPLDAIRHPVRVRFTLNGAPLGAVTATEMENESRYVVDAEDYRANVLRVDLSDSFVPARLGGSADQRELGMMLRSWEWGPVKRP